MTGQIGRPGTGLHPLRGQNNVQGASDAGLIPMMYPDYQRVDDTDGAARASRALWDCRCVELDDKPGLTVVEIMNAIHAGNDPRHVHHGREPGDVAIRTSDHAREALAKLEMLVVQDIFLTETAYLADVILPASAFAGEDRHLHQHRPLRAARPPGAGPAGRGAPGPGDHHRRWRSASASTGTMAHPREVRFDEMRHDHAVDRRHHLGAAGARSTRHLSRASTEGDPGERGGVHRHLSDARPAGRASCPPTSFRRTSGPTPSIRWC